VNCLLGLSRLHAEQSRRCSILCIPEFVNSAQAFSEKTSAPHSPDGRYMNDVQVQVGILRLLPDRQVEIQDHSLVQGDSTDGFLVPLQNRR
jgi:hypothetical protein